MKNKDLIILRKKKKKIGNTNLLTKLYIVVHLSQDLVQFFLFFFFVQPEIIKSRHS